MSQIFQIIPIKDDIIKSLIEVDLTNNIYISNLDLVCKLQVEKNLPITNTYLATKNILSFLRWADIQMNLKGGSLLPIDSNIFIKFFKRDNYKQYLTLLNTMKVLTIVPYDDGGFFKLRSGNQPGRFNQYRFYNDYLNSDLCLVMFNNTKHGLTTELKLDKRFIDAIKHTTIDYKSAFEAEIEYAKSNGLTTNNLRIRLTKLFSLNGDRFIKKGEKVNRIYHSFTNLSKVSRQFMQIDGMTYNDIDIVNCQPLLLCYYLKKKGLPVDDNYVYDCQTGMVYDNFLGFAERINVPVKKKGKYTTESRLMMLDRDGIKVELYRSIYFDFKESSPLNREFGNKYPLTYQSLKEISETGNETIASILQNIEAEIFNDLIPKKSKYFYTLFDAIYFTDLSDFSHLYEMIRDKFMKYGITPMIKVNGGTDYDLMDIEKQSPYSKIEFL